MIERERPPGRSCRSRGFMTSVPTSQRPRTWEPLLDGSVAKRARTGIDEIAEALSMPPPAWAPPGGPEAAQAVLDASLAGGRAGLAGLFAALGGSRSNPDGSRR